MKKIPSEFDDLVGEMPADAGESFELPTLSFERLDYDPRPSSTANGLAKAATLRAFREDILGDEVLPKPAVPPTPTLSLAERTTQSINTAVNGVFAKVQRVTAGTSKRQSRIATILNDFKQSLIAKGFAADEWDGWPALAKHSDEAVASCLMAVE